MLLADFFKIIRATVAGMITLLALKCKSLPITILVAWYLHTQLVAEEEQEIRSSPRYRHTSESIQ